jgi:Ca-activated chloride channel family protein
MNAALARLAALLPAVALVALPAARAQQPDAPDYVLRNDTVLVNVVVTEGAKFADGLTASDFEVTEDGAPQKIDNLFAEETPFAAAILLDKSGSMEYKLRLARVAAARFMDRTRPEDRVAVYLFGSDVKQLQDFTPGGRDLVDNVWDTSAEGVTKMYDCIGQAADALAHRTEFRRAILLLSDGADYGSAVNYDAAVRRALAAGVTIYTIDLAPIGGTHTLQKQEELQARGILKGLADKSGGRFFASKGGTDLNDAFAQIVDEISHQYTIAYSSTNAKHDGTWRKIGVRCARSGVKIRARDGYHAPTE